MKRPSSARPGRWPLALLVLVGSALAFGTPWGSDQRRVTAMFPSTVNLYKGAKVKVLGVAVGKVTSVKVVGTSVRVEMTYSGVDLPKDVHALIVPPSIVGDRFVQLAPAYTSGAPARRRRHHRPRPHRGAARARRDLPRARRARHRAGPAGGQQEGRALATGEGVGRHAQGQRPPVPAVPRRPRGRARHALRRRRELPAHRRPDRQARPGRCRPTTRPYDASCSRSPASPRP